VVRKTLLSAAALGLMVPSAAFAAKPKPAAAKAPTRKPAVAAKPAAPKPARATPGLDTCEFQVRTRSKVGYRGSATYFVKGDWVREEKRSGGGMELIMVSNDTGLFIRNKHSDYWFRYPEKMATKLRDRLTGGPVGDVKSFLKQRNAAYLGKEKVEGVMCNIWTYRYKGTDDKFRLWTDLANTRPIRLERDHLVPSSRKRDVLVIEYKRYVSGQKLADSLFQIPAGQKVHDLRNALTPGKFRKKTAQERQSGAPAPGAPTTDTPPSETPSPEATK
jgi:outer membrane lipoprotein-sorting protein